MPNNRQATRRVKQAAKANMRNKSDKRQMKTAIKKLLVSVSNGDFSIAKTLFSSVQKILDTLAKKKVISANTASRYKKRLNSKVKSIAK